MTDKNYRGIEGVNYPEDGKRWHQRDFQEEQDRVGSEILDRESDFFTPGVIAGWDVTVSAAVGHVTVSPGSGRDGIMRRMKTVVPVDVLVPDGQTTILVARHLWVDNDYDSTVNETNRIHSHAVEFTTVPSIGDVDSDREIPLWSISRNGTVINFVKKFMDLSRQKTLAFIEEVAANLTAAKAYADDQIAMITSSLPTRPIVGSTLRIDLRYFPCSKEYPWWCLGQPNTTISATRYPDLADALRNFAAAFEPWGDNKSSFSVASATRSSNVATITLAKNDWLSGTVTANYSTALTFSVSQTIPAGSVLILESGPIINVRDAVSGTSGVADTEIYASASRVRIATYEELLVRAIAEARLKHGSYTDWFCVTLASAIGTISAGDYAITGLSVANNSLSFASSGADGSFTGPFSNVIQVFPFRIPASLDARHYSIAGHTLVSHGDRDRSIMAGFMRLDYMQGFRVVAARTKGWYNQSGGWDDSGNYDSNIGPTNDTVNGTPRIAKTTHGADYGVNFAVFVGSVNQ